MRTLISRSCAEIEPLENSGHFNHAPERTNQIKRDARSGEPSKSPCGSPKHGYHQNTREKLS